MPIAWSPGLLPPGRDSVALLSAILGTDYGLGPGLSSSGLNAGMATIAANGTRWPGSTYMAVASCGRGKQVMWYAIEGHDGKDVLVQRLTARAQHLARLHVLCDAGRLLLAGPCPTIDAEDPGPAGFSGSIVIAEFASLDEARVWAQADPYVAAGVYARVDVRPFNPVLP